MTRREEAVQALERGLRRGDFRVGGFPPERRLAQIMGVSRMTARLAIQDLMAAGLLRRQENGRVTADPDRLGRRGVQGVFLAPASNSVFIRNLRVLAERLGPAQGVFVQAVDYTGWEDPAINDALEHFDAVFIAGCGGYPSARVARKLRGCGKPVVSVESDLSGNGIPSLMLYPHFCVRQLLDYLYEQGHRRVDCFNVLPLTLEVQKRIAMWRLWLEENGLTGRLVSQPGGSEPDTLRDAYELMRRYLYTDHAPAVFFTGCVCAIGALRAAQEAGVRPGAELSACVLGGDGPLHRYLTPALTALEAPDAGPYLQRFLRWFCAGGTWEGPLLLTPERFEIFPGETVANLHAGR